MHKTTQKIHRTTQKLGRVRVVLRLCGIYPGICLTTEEKARKNLSIYVCMYVCMCVRLYQGDSRRMDFRDSYLAFLLKFIETFRLCWKEQQIFYAKS